MILTCKCETHVLITVETHDYITSEFIFKSGVLVCLKPCVSYGYPDSLIPGPCNSKIVWFTWRWPPYMWITRFKTMCFKLGCIVMVLARDTDRTFLGTYKPSALALPSLWLRSFELILFCRVHFLLPSTFGYHEIQLFCLIGSASRANYR